MTDGGRADDLDELVDEIDMDEAAEALSALQGEVEDMIAKLHMVGKLGEEIARPLEKLQDIMHELQIWSARTVEEMDS